ncbi:MAG: choice-of-anchor Q domain-containing protein [Dokdonella sp.]
MSLRIATLNGGLRLRPLALCMAALLGSASSAVGASADNFMSAWPLAAHSARGVQARGADFAFRTPRTPHRVDSSAHPPRSLVVSSCADDNSPGTLRSVVATAVDGDTVDLGALACSTITLALGAIRTDIDNLQIQGPGRQLLSIDGAHADRVLVLGGAGTLAVADVSLVNGLLTGDYNGGCMRSYGNILLTRTQVSGCEIDAVGYAAGGGVAARADLTVIDSTISGNTISVSSNYYGYLYGGGVNAVGDIVISGSTISGNTQVFLGTPTPYTLAYGGGVSARSTLSVTQSTIDGNQGATFGGGVFFTRNSLTFSRVEIVQSTISGNAATRAGGGISIGGQFKPYLDSFVLHNSTVAANVSAGSGGGVRFRDYTLADVQSSIVASNSANNGADISADESVAIYGADNLVLDVGPTIALPGDTVRADPVLQPLADNGGPTRTQALGEGSPAIDAGNDYFGLPFDQRGEGFARITDGRADIGAFESGSSNVTDRIFADGFDPAA